MHVLRPVGNARRLVLRKGMSGLRLEQPPHVRLLCLRLDGLDHPRMRRLARFVGKPRNLFLTHSGQLGCRGNSHPISSLLKREQPQRSTSKTRNFIELAMLASVFITALGQWQSDWSRAHILDAPTASRSELGI